MSNIFLFTLSKHSSFPYNEDLLNEWRSKHYPNRGNRTARKSLAERGGLVDPRDQALERTARGGEKGWDREACLRRAGYRDRPGIWTPLCACREGRRPTLTPRLEMYGLWGGVRSRFPKDGSFSSHLPLAGCEGALGRWPFNLLTTLEVGSVSGILDRPIWPSCDFIYRNYRLCSFQWLGHKSWQWHFPFHLFW